MFKVHQHTDCALLLADRLGARQERQQVLHCIERVVTAWSVASVPAAAGHCLTTEGLAAVRMRGLQCRT